MYFRIANPSKRVQLISGAADTSSLLHDLREAPELRVVEFEGQ
jgi:hypothetical protein